MEVGQLLCDIHARNACLQPMNRRSFLFAPLALLLPSKAPVFIGLDCGARESVAVSITFTGKDFTYDERMVSEMIWRINEHVAEHPLLQG